MALAAQTPPTLPMPIEVLGHKGATRSVVFSLPRPGTQIEIVANNLNYPNKGSVSINSSAPLPLNNSTVTPVGLDQAWGGIGGVMGNTTFLLPANLRAGRNVLTFRYHRADYYDTPGGPVEDNSVGWTVVSLRVLDESGANLLTSVQTNPADYAWDPSLVTDGARLWRGFTESGQRYFLLSQVNGGGSGVSWLATCADCHADDGSDLKYFNASPLRIRERALLHGLTPERSEKIVSYILSLTNVRTSPYARPWNPPYQPGPGLDSRRPQDWAAGAGWQSVVSHPELMLNALHPGLVGLTNGILGWNISAIQTGNLPPNRYVSPREIPVFIQMPDWNRWLPDIHPLDAFQRSRTLTDFLATYNSLKSALNQGNLNHYKELIPQWMLQHSRLMSTYGHQSWSSDQTRNRRFYSASQWMAVKLWYLHQAWGLETLSPAYYGPRAEPLSYIADQFFFNKLSPDLLHFAPGTTGLGDVRNDIVSRVSWYHFQSLVFSGHRIAEAASSYPWIGFAAGMPFDVSYTYAAWYNLAQSTGVSSFPVQYLYVALFNQFFDTGLGPEFASLIGPDGTPRASGGWHAGLTSPYSILAYSGGSASNGYLGQTPPHIASALMEALVSTWLQKSKAYSREQYRAGSYPRYSGWSMLPGLPPFALSGDAAHLFYRMLLRGTQLDRLEGWGVSPATLNEFVDWCMYLWPEFAGHFNALRR